MTFKDANGDNLADDDGNTTARIETINGSATNQADEQNATPDASGTITFTVDSTTTESVVPVVWLDADTTAGVATPDQELDLVAPATANNDPKEPAEEFGIGGVKEWFIEAAAGDVGVADIEITKVDKAANFFDAGGERYFYDANDTFQIDNAGTCENVSQSAFESALSAGDMLDESSIYGDKDSATAGADNSTLCIQNTNPDAPSSVNANRVNDTSATVDIADDDTAQDSFNIYRASTTNTTDACPNFNVAGADNRDKFALVGSVAEDGDNAAPEESFTDTGLTPNTQYCYAVTAVNDGDESDTATSDSTVTLAAGDTAEPVSQRAEVTNDEVANVFDEGTLSSGDVHRIVFDEPIEAPGAGDTYRVVDAQGEYANITQGVNATMSVNNSAVTIGGQTYAAGRVLTVTIGGLAGTNVPVGGDTDGNSGNNNGVINYPVTITAASGFVDTDGDNAPWTPADDPDNVLEVNESAPATTQIAPFITGADITTEGATLTAWDEVGDVLTVTFSEVVNDTDADDSLSEAQLEAILGTEVAYAATSTVTVAGGGTDTLTFTIGTAALTEGVAEGDTVDGTANPNVEDLDLNDQVANPNANPTVAAN